MMIMNKNIIDRWFFAITFAVWVAALIGNLVTLCMGHNVVVAYVSLALCLLFIPRAIFSFKIAAGKMYFTTHEGKELKEQQDYLRERFSVFSDVKKYTVIRHSDDSVKEIRIEL